MLSDEMPESTPVQTVTYPRTHDLRLTFLPEGELKTVEVRQNEFAQFILSLNGKVVAHSSNPNDLWAAYHTILLTPTEGDRILARGMGVTFDSGPTPLPFEARYTATRGQIVQLMEFDMPSLSSIEGEQRRAAIGEMEEGKRNGWRTN